MSELIVAANRGPLSLSVSEGGELVVEQAAGGLAPSLARALGHSGATWIACAMNDGDRLANATGRTPRLLEGVDLELLEIDEQIVRDAYRVIANETLWYLNHAMFDLTRAPLFDHAWRLSWEGYRAFNARFAEAIAERADDGAVVVVNDYHLSLVGAELSASRPDLKTVYFCHTPFPSPDEFSVLPDDIAAELISSIASFGASGFHSATWAGNFAASATSLAIDANCFVAPLGVDADELRHLAASPGVRARRSELEELLAGRALLARSDRIEPSKNLLRGFLAFEEMLARDPSIAERVLFLARTYPSRTDLLDYRDYRVRVEEVVDRCNGRFARADRPCIVLDVQDDYDSTLACLTRYDALLVNPIRDGMNLVAKEGPVLNDQAGVLMLSTRAGAFEELGEDCLAIDPFDVAATSRALERALGMPASERNSRARRLAGLSAAHPPAAWLSDLLAHACSPKSARS